MQQYELNKNIQNLYHKNSHIHTLAFLLVLLAMGSHCSSELLFARV